MPPASNPTRAAVEAAVLDLTDEQIVEALVRKDQSLKEAVKQRTEYAWPREAQLNVLDALARRLAGGRVAARG